MSGFEQLLEPQERSRKDLAAQGLETFLEYAVSKHADLKISRKEDRKGGKEEERLVADCLEA